MKDQRWDGDYETLHQEFRAAREQEQMGLSDVNRSLGNDYIADARPVILDGYQMGELEPSWATQLDSNGMQPHAREYLERDLTGLRSSKKFTQIAGQVIDYCDGIQFSGRP